MNILQAIAKPFLGSGLTVRYPIVGRLFSRIYRLWGTDLVDVPIPLGLRLRIPRNDEGIGLVLLSTGHFEPFETETLLGLLKDGQTFFDVGANVGYYTVLAATKVGPAGQVVAFEPDQRNLELLKANVRLNALSNVMVVDQAVSGSSGTALLHVSEFDPSRHTIVDGARARHDQQRPIRSTTLDEWCEEHRIYPDVMKIDIEGAEGLLVLGAHGVLSGARPASVLMEFIPPRIAASGVDPGQLLQSLRAFGFQIRLMDERSAKVVPWEEGEWEAVGGSYQVRNLLLRKGVVPTGAQP